MESLDLVVVGAGMFGLAAAKNYRQLNPDKTLAILEAGSSLGGVWAKDRLYPSLKTNNMLGTYEYPDFPMDTATFGVKPGEHIPGAVVHAYLSSYAEKFDILGRIRYCSKVLSAEHRDDDADGGWTLTVQTGQGETKLLARKLILAAGLTSEPFLPDFEGQGKFGVPLFHGRDFLKHADTLDSAKSVVVFGGTKSAWDAAFAYASKGVKVDWVIRESGHGPAWLAPPYVTPLKKWLEKLVHTRMLTWFSPCVWGDADGYTKTRGFYHGTAIGRAITNAFWSVLGGDVITLNKYDAHPETKKLKPWSEAMFTASSFSILNYPTNIFDLVRDGTIRVHIADVVRLSPRTVHLSGGSQVETDAMCCVTGWKHVPLIKFLPEGVDRELGLPHVPGDDATEPLLKAEAVDRADREILARFPRLKSQPVQNKNMKPLLATDGLSTTDKINPSTPLTPYTLYHFIVPPSARFLQARDVAFAGVLMNFNTPVIAHAQSVWISAYFNDQLSAQVVPPVVGNSAATPGSEDTGNMVKTIDELRYETVLHARFGKWRYPAGHGAQFPDFVFDALPYVDLLLRDLGLPIYRKAGWLAEATEPYGPEDYKDLVAEFAAKTPVS
ncbi:hypothetical protein B0T26DRAFT_644428 [Lasiosphaeria miniovina]|uniref:FAD/NAD(P)-binding domain-containing protein n=1 Tax=Lasiosphaeria miniovina TaxID=1954250 RepID=A0AA40ATG7_9PEZI|nr:uncharacterized protein B0T26DRAFT_644428 [Lasiosphaeria miniovina]KAK0721673.1 hypothetical protein B0T26DRAFT_644428 [Lasiosphaeria miniovina]